MTHEERVLAALIQSGLRNDLGVTEEAAGYFRLVEASWKIRNRQQRKGSTVRRSAD